MLSAAAGPETDPEPSAPPPAPSDLRVFGRGESFTLAWRDNADGEAGYLVHRSSDPDFAGATIITLASNAQSFSDTSPGPPGTRLYYRVSTYDRSGSSGFSAVVSAVAGQVQFPAASLSFHFDEGAGTTTADASGSGRSGQLEGPSSWAKPGRIGPRAVTFDSLDGTSVVTVRDGGGSNFDLAQLLGGTASLAAWIRTTQSGGDLPTQSPGITGVNELGGTNDAFWGWIDAAGRIGVSAGDGPAAKSLQPVNDGTWHHVAFTRDASTGRVQTYVDGILNDSVLSEAGLKTDSYSQIGSIGRVLGLRASLDELSVYPWVLSAAEVALLAAPRLPPAAASDLSLISSGTANVLHWADNSSDETGFIIQRSPDPSFAEDVASFQVGGDQVRYVDAAADVTKTYHYRVVAVGEAGEAPPSNAVSGRAGVKSQGAAGHYFANETFSGTPDLVRLDAPVDLSSVASGWPNTPGFPNDRFSVIWTGKVRAPVTGTYTFVTATDDAGVLYVDGRQVSEDLQPPGFRDAVNLTPIQLVAGREYEFVMKMRQGVGNAIAQLKWVVPGTGGARVIVAASNLSPFSDAPATPTGFSASDVTTSQATLSWDDVAVNELRYILERSLDPSFDELVPVAVLGDHYGTSPMTFTDAGLARNTRYYYRLRAENFDGPSGYAVLTVDTAPADAAHPLSFGGTPGADTFYLRRDGDLVSVYANATGDGVPILAREYASISAITFTGSADDRSRLVLDFTGGNPVPPGGMSADGSGGLDDRLVIRAHGDETIIDEGSQVRVGGAVVAVANYERVEIDLERLVVASRPLAQVFGAKFALPQGVGHVVRVGDLSIGPGARLDLRDNELIVTGGDVTEIESLVRSARNDAAGRWLGPGLTSSPAINDTLAGLAVGMVNGDVVVKLARNGDATLDGRINADDYFSIDSAFLAQPVSPSYAQGDFNYDGKINADDYFLIDSVFLGQGQPLASTAVIAAAPSTVAAAPVPAAQERKATQKRPSRLLFSDRPVGVLVASRRAGVARRR